MHVNGQRLLKLINDLLDLAKLESDRFTIRRCQIDLYSLLEDIVVGAGPMAERKGICLSLSPRVGTPFAFLDRDAVEKVVVNLVSNALKFTGAGGSRAPHRARRGGPATRLRRGLRVARAERGDVPVRAPRPALDRSSPSATRPIPR